MKVTSLGHIIDVTHDASVQIVVVVNSMTHTAQTHNAQEKN
jgi:collagenase-like PrtC family protease